MPPVKKKKYKVKDIFEMPKPFIRQKTLQSFVTYETLNKCNNILSESIDETAILTFNKSTSYATWLVIISWLMFGIGCLIATYVKSI